MRARPSSGQRQILLGATRAGVCSAQRDARVPSSSLAAPPPRSKAAKNQGGKETVFQMTDGKEREMIVDWVRKRNSASLRRGCR
jgi:hypothetical protein